MQNWIHCLARAYINAKVNASSTTAEQAKFDACLAIKESFLKAWFYQEKHTKSNFEKHDQPALSKTFKGLVEECLVIMPFFYLDEIRSIFTFQILIFIQFFTLIA